MNESNFLSLEKALNLTDGVFDWWSVWLMECLTDGVFDWWSVYPALVFTEWSGLYVSERSFHLLKTREMLFLSLTFAYTGKAVPHIRVTHNDVKGIVVSGLCDFGFPKCCPQLYKGHCCLVSKLIIPWVNVVNVFYRYMSGTYISDFCLQYDRCLLSSFVIFSRSSPTTNRHVNFTVESIPKISQHHSGESSLCLQRRQIFTTLLRSTTVIKKWLSVGLCLPLKPWH